jgi:hypothetical protein
METHPLNKSLDMISVIAPYFDSSWSSKEQYTIDFLTSLTWKSNLKSYTLANITFLSDQYVRSVIAQGASANLGMIWIIM